MGTLSQGTFLHTRKAKKMTNTVKNTLYFENDRLALKKNALTLKNENISARLSALQNKLLWCLVRDITERQGIIQEIWPDANWKSKGNNYNQLVFQTQTTLKHCGFPADTLIISPGKGIGLNANLLKPITSPFGDGAYTLHDQGLMFIR